MSRPDWKVGGVYICPSEYPEVLKSLRDSNRFFLNRTPPTGPSAHIIFMHKRCMHESSLEYVLTNNSRRDLIKTLSEEKGIQPLLKDPK
jgi:hypothetical protein